MSATIAAPGAVRPAVRERLRIEIGGTVQGVGFRPFVWRKATALGISGSVANTADGVVIEAEGEGAALAAFLRALRTEAPANARIARFRVGRCPVRGETGFSIVESVAAGEHEAAILPDLATCPDCLEEIRDSANRRYRYPFTNCTHCGPRYSIIRDIPYDRGRTTMAAFVLCPD
ncbi:MAG TPA: acylphosphatase, partial [Bauldia sp.]|nr:acylphosphatase [Bauldia sp.]